MVIEPSYTDLKHLHTRIEKALVRDGENRGKLHEHKLLKIFNLYNYLSTKGCGLLVNEVG